MEQSRESGFLRFKDNEFRETAETVVVERHFEIWFEDMLIASFICSPGNQKQLALGYLLTSGLITRTSDVEIISSEETRLEFTSSSKTDFVKRFLVNQTSGSQSLDPLTPNKGRQITLTDLRKSVSNLLTGQPIHSQTGGVHGALIQNLETLEHIIVEDIGRFNAVDKVVGSALEAEYDLSNALLLATGRLTSEMVSKAIRAKVPILGSLAIATDLGIHFAMNAHLTLMGRLKDPSFWLYNQGHALVIP